MRSLPVSNDVVINSNSGAEVPLRYNGALRRKNMDKNQERSAMACPRCGAHRLATMAFPDVDQRPFQPFSDIIAMPGKAETRALPRIHCLACEAEWRDLDDFRAEVDSKRA